MGDPYLLIAFFCKASLVTGGFGLFLVFSHIGICLDAVKTLKLLKQCGQSFIAVFKDSPGVTRLCDLKDVRGFLEGGLFIGSGWGIRFYFGF